MSLSRYPSALDNEASIPVAIDNVTPISALCYNRLRDAILAVESELGADPSRVFGTVRARIDSLRAEINTIKTEIGSNASGSFDTIEARLDFIEASLGDALTVPILANQIDASQRITIPFSLNEVIAVNVFTAIGGDVFDPSTIPNPSSSRQITFNASINTSLASTQAQLRLFNVTDGVVVTGTEFSSISLTPELNTIVLAVPAVLPNSSKTYEVQLRTATAAVAFCQKAELIITWS